MILLRGSLIHLCDKCVVYIKLVIICSHTQNLAEIEDIPLVEKICAVTLTASERALYLELEHYLRAQELKMKKTGKSQSDRVRRLNKALGESK
jgi:hypothetical protein